MKDGLWSLDLFRWESATLRTHWILVIMDQYTRRIIGFGVHAGAVDGTALCRMFNHAIAGQLDMPKCLSCDHDPLFLFERWRANLVNFGNDVPALWVLEVAESVSVSIRHRQAVQLLNESLRGR